MFRKLRRYLGDPYHEIGYDLMRTHPNWLPDKWYLKLLWEYTYGYELDLEHPKTFNEKLNWLKLYHRKPEYTLMVDKYEVKKIVSSCIGSQYVVDNYAVANKWEDIDFSKLPERFVVKCTHDSGGAFVCHDKKCFDFDGTRKQVMENLNTNYYYSLREWPYKNVKPRIVVDRLLDEHTGNKLQDYKFWCFDGQPVYMYCTIKGGQVYENFYDMEFQPVPIDHAFPRHKPEFERPSHFELMKELATQLSQGIPFVRVDFFYVEGQVYFGEYTFYDWGGFRSFSGDWDERLGDLIKLPK